MKRTIIILILGIISSQLIGQDVRTDLNASFEKWKQLESFSVDLTVSLHDSKEIERMEGNIIQKGENFLSRFEHIVSQQNKDLTLMYDTDEKAILISKPQQRATTPFEQVNPDSLIKYATESILLSTNTLGRTYRLSFPEQSPYKNVDLRIDASSGLVMEIVLEFTTPNEVKDENDNTRMASKMKFRLSNLDTKSKIEKSIFSTSHLVFVTNDGFKLNPALSDHELIDLTEQ